MTNKSLPISEDNVPEKLGQSQHRKELGLDCVPCQKIFKRVMVARNRPINDQRAKDAINVLSTNMRMVPASAIRLSYKSVRKAACWSYRTL